MCITSRLCSAYSASCGLVSPSIRENRRGCADAESRLRTARRRNRDDNRSAIDTGVARLLLISEYDNFIDCGLAGVVSRHPPFACELTGHLKRFILLIFKRNFGGDSRSLFDNRSDFELSRMPRRMPDSYRTSAHHRYIVIAEILAVFGDHPDVDLSLCSQVLPPVSGFKG